MTDYRCRVCNAALPATASICPGCGRTLDRGGPAQLPINRVGPAGTSQVPQATLLSSGRKALIGISLTLALLSTAFAVAAIGNAGALGDSVIIMSQDDAFTIFFSSIAAGVLALVGIIALLSAPKTAR